MKAGWILGFGVFAVLGIAGRAIAHGAVLNYSLTQAYEILATYDNGDPMREAQIAIFSPDDPTNPWLTATTDDQGRFLFAPPSPGNWEVQVRQAGHGDLLVIPVDAPPVAGNESDASEPGAVPVVQTNETAPAPGNLSGLQKGLMAGSVIWGFVGTALFFSKGKKG